MQPVRRPKQSEAKQRAMIWRFDEVSIGHFHSDGYDGIRPDVCNLCRSRPENCRFTVPIVQKVGVCAGWRGRFQPWKSRKNTSFFCSWTFEISIWSSSFPSVVDQNFKLRRGTFHPSDRIPKAAFASVEGRRCLRDDPFTIHASTIGAFRHASGTFCRGVTQDGR